MKLTMLQNDGGIMEINEELKTILQTSNKCVIISDYEPLSQEVTMNTINRLCNHYFNLPYSEPLTLDELLDSKSLNVEELVCWAADVRALFINTPLKPPTQA